MRKRLLLSGLTLTVIVAGVIALAAFTAQVVNLTARVEKDIAVEPVICANPGDIDTPCFVDPRGGDFGVTLPQEFYDRIIEVTLSNSFFEQDRFNDLSFDILWECKQFANERDVVDNLTGRPNVTNLVGLDGFPDCRSNYLETRTIQDTHELCAVDLDSDGIPDIIRHCDPEVLDDNIRDHITVTEFLNPALCLVDQEAANNTPRPPEKEVEYVATGFLDKVNHKCRYELKFFAPPCAGSFNKFTDPHPLNSIPGGINPIDCHKADLDLDNNPATLNPQEIDEFADFGDDFKIQVFAHSLQPCGGVLDFCIDADGTATAGRGLPGAAEVVAGDPLTSFPDGIAHSSGLDWFDQDGNGIWSFGDDLHLEGAEFCSTGIRNGRHELGDDCKVLDLNNSLFTGDQVDCDLEVGANFNTTVTVCPDPLIKYFDADGDGAYDDGEDIVLDLNNNGIFD